mgnify:CR=1 FL=1
MEKKRFVFIILLSLSFCGVVAQKPIRFNSDTRYAIVLPEKPSQNQVLAADQLAIYLEYLGFKVTGIENAQAYRGSHAIFIGRSRQTEKLYRQYGSQIRDDGFILHTDGRNLYILGQRGKSELYGVYHLLENYFDVTKTDDDSEGIFFFSMPKERELCIHDLQNPSFRYRETLHNLPNKATGYADWHKLSCREDFEKDWGLFVHTFQKLVPIDTYFDEHPDWFDGEAWGNIAFDWSNKALREWFTETLVNNILFTGADGYRCDCEPNYTGYDIFGAARERLAEKGKYIAVISEDTGTRKSVYDFEQDGVLDYDSMDRGMLYQNPVNFFTDGYLSIVDSVKTGEGIGSYSRMGKTLKRGKSRYYTNCITNHDYQKRNVCGNRLKIGYSAILAPFIPIWYMGDEFNASNPPGVLYDLYVDFSEAENEENAAFLEDVKQMIKIRRTFSDIFEYWPTNHRNSNICKVKTENLGSLQAYARYADNKAVIIAANNTAEIRTGTVKIPFINAGINGYRHYTVTDLMTGAVIAEGSKNDVKKFTAEIEPDYVGTFLVEGTEPVSDLFICISSFFRALPERIYAMAVNMLAA